MPRGGWLTRTTPLGVYYGRMEEQWNNLSTPFSSNERIYRGVDDSILPRFENKRSDIIALSSRGERDWVSFNRGQGGMARLVASEKLAR